MMKGTMLGTTFATLALLASIAGITAGTADAKPREVNCIGVEQVMTDSLDLAHAAYSQGDQRGGDLHMRQYASASKNYARYCLS